MDSVLASIDSPWKIACVVLACLCLVSLASLMMRPQPYTSNLRELIRQSAQLYEIAKQDQDTALALQHSTEALSILLICRRLAADAVIESETRIKVGELSESLGNLQASCIAKLSPRNPSMEALAAGYASL